MSGIAGIINLDGRPVPPSWLECMADRLAHRGGDHHGSWIKGAVGLCHQALWTTPEASLESLPMETPGGIVITGDFRLDNREELLGALASGGQMSAATPDGALVAAAYQKWGEDCVELLLGDFAFAIWDQGQHRLFCARDHMGIKPFYYAVLPHQRFVFASEIKAVLSIPGISDKLNELRIADAFVHLVNDPAGTYYSQVLRLPAAHAMTVRKTVSARRYWRLNPKKELRLNSDKEYGEGYRHHFSEAVRCRLRSTLPVGSMLSGGLDSSSVSCVARNFLKANGHPKLQTFSAVFDEVRECDERPYIQTVLDQGHCEANYIILDSLSPLSDAETIMWHLDEPLSAGNLYLGWNAFRKAQQLGVRVVLDGFDGDTTVSHGSGRMIELARAGRWRDLALELRGGSRNFNGRFWLDCLWRWMWKYHPAAQRINHLWRGARRRLGAPQKAAEPPFNPIDFLNPELSQRCNLREIAAKPREPVVWERDRHFQLLEREIMTKCVEMLDHAASGFGVEVRFPFMDIRLIDYCLSLPSDQKMRRGFTRFVMRGGMEGILPEKIRWRGGKSDLGPSFEKGLFKFERDNLERIILEEENQLAPYVHLRRLKDSLGKFRRGMAQEHDVTLVWTAVALALWLRSRRTGQEGLILNGREVRKE